MAVRTTNAGTGETAEKSGTSTSQAEGTAVRKPSGPVLEIPAAISVQRLADVMRASNIEVIKQLMRRGVMANINQVIAFETASIIASDFGFRPTQTEETKTTHTAQKPDTTPVPPEEEDTSLLQPRAPVVTILGHVDHGKTTLLDVIRQSSITSTEKGGITQHIGAYQVLVNDKQITFLDTPGHEAFSAMRARGTQVTDIAVLVIAADDGVMPQTREAIDHAKAAGVPIVVALNKIDMPAANIDRVKQQLTELELAPEDWGGDTIVVPISAKTEEGIPDLLENILLVAEIAELKANPDKKAQGVVVEAKLDATRGAVATVLVQSGTLHVGDTFSVGNCRGKVRALFDDHGHRVQSAGPTIPVEVLGIESVPRTGDLLSVEEGGRKPRPSVERDRQRREAEVDQGKNATEIERLLSQVRAGDAKEFNIVLKTDVEGSSEAIRSAIEGLGSDDVIVKIIRTSSGVVTESDILLAAASNATVMAFNTKAEVGAKKLASLEDITIRHYGVIYDLVNDVVSAVSGLREPVYREVIEARAEVKDIFKVKGGKVAGVGITDGKVNRNAQIRVIRGSDVIHESNIKSLRHFKDTVKELVAGTEGGIGVDGFDDFQVGDILEVYRKEQVDPPS